MTWELPDITQPFDDRIRGFYGRWGWLMAETLCARGQSRTEVRPTLADAGIDKKLSSRAQKVAN